MPKRDKKLVTRSIPAFIARTQFGQILERVSAEKERILVTKNGEAKAVIMGVEDFLQAVVKTPASLRALQEEAKRTGANKLSLDDIEAEIQAVRRAKSPKQV
jgi:prevent-host-death family protein